MLWVARSCRCRSASRTSSCTTGSRLGRYGTRDLEHFIHVHMLRRLQQYGRGGCVLKQAIQHGTCGSLDGIIDWVLKSATTALFLVVLAGHGQQSLLFDPDHHHGQGSLQNTFFFSGQTRNIVLGKGQGGSSRLGCRRRSSINSHGRHGHLSAPLVITETTSSFAVVTPCYSSSPQLLDKFTIL